jgi:hypothetical protein
MQPPLRGRVFGEGSGHGRIPSSSKPGQRRTRVELAISRQAEPHSICVWNEELIQPFGIRILSVDAKANDQSSNRAHNLRAGRKSGG